MRALQNRTSIANGIKDLINVRGAKQLTLVIDASDANQLADDILFCTYATGRHYRIASLSGDIPIITKKAD